ncbi:PIN domain-like protein [Marasmius fiardii PR-910]|nr:PIN domain-like protein [Marasmius fiardii PR-910]
MGVLGLTPFLQKTIPKAITLLPKRLEGFSGKIIVFDGTLITQRLHFTQLPHPYRHVLGWFRVIKELKDNNVHAICVFDGKDRSVAKAKEALRRKQVQRLASVRQLIEGERLKRLVQLKSALSGVDWNDPTQRTLLADILQSVASDKLTTRPVDYSIIDEPLWLDYSDPAVQSSSTGVYLPSESFIHDEDIWVTDDPSIDQIPEQDLTLALQDITNTSNISSRISTTRPSRPPPTPDAPTYVLASLYTEYRRSIPKLSSFPRASMTEDTETDKLEYEMSKTQHQLTREEGDFWDVIASSPTPTPTTTPALTPTTTPAPTPAPETLLTNLTKKSVLLSESYKRRAHPPTSQHYAEAKELLIAMGVPCIDSQGSFEAEAVASSIVLNGLADYVASEDTDVLIYGAPLLRNISNRREPLLSFPPSTEIQNLLGLTSREMLIDFALLLGTDFTKRIKNVGPARALKLMRTYKSIERVLESEEVKKIKERYSSSSTSAAVEEGGTHSEYLNEVEAGREVFRTIPPVPDSSALRGVERDEEKIVYLMGKYGLSSELDGDYWDYHTTYALEGNYFGDNPNNEDEVGLAGF